MIFGLDELLCLNVGWRETDLGYKEWARHGLELDWFNPVQVYPNEIQSPNEVLPIHLVSLYLYLYFFLVFFLFALFLAKSSPTLSLIASWLACWGLEETEFGYVG